ncbi:GAF domain-containing sensor histidine kinase [Neobacillus mesonae]|nr:GAF domain-containing sensor histidine kinase [Neobacillus mesonae]
MALDHRMQELLILKTIAEKLNASHDLNLVLHEVLGKLMELTGLTSSWIFLTEGGEVHELTADYNLPPGLTYNDKQPLCGDSCWCLNRYRNNKMMNAVNTANCKRLEDALHYQWGDTWSMTHHASVPLQSGERSFGLMNVASPNKDHFSEQELALLQAVAYQIGSAIERTRLYTLEQRRAELFSSVGELVNSLGTVLEQLQDTDHTQIMDEVLNRISEHFDWTLVAWLEFADETLIRYCVKDGILKRSELSLSPESAGWSTESEHHSYHIIPSDQIPIPVEVLKKELGVDSGITWIASKTSSCAGHENNAVLLVGTTLREPIIQADGEAIDALMDAVLSLCERAFLEKQRRELARLAERDRIARDLHDSVNQMLFSMSMTAKGIERLLANDQKEAALPYVADMQIMSQTALKEMRALIMQLRPADLHLGLTQALKQYGEQLGLKVRVRKAGSADLPVPSSLEETLYRIGQEALNNVSKHAQAEMTIIELHHMKDQLKLTIQDNGIGMDMMKPDLVLDTTPYSMVKGSVGLSSMRERAEAAGGTVEYSSSIGSGTKITVRIPY